MIDGGIQQPPLKFVDPKMVQEGGDKSWDETRLVAEQAKF